MLDITVTVILVNKTAELVIVQKLYQLCIIRSNVSHFSGIKI